MTRAVHIAVFDGLSAAAAERELLTCCASPVWAAAVAAGRPYRSPAALRAAADAALRALTWPDVLSAVNAHPRIGAAPAGTDREARWSRREQAGAAGGDDATRGALVEVNEAYERRFGHVFLIAAAGRSGPEMLAAARTRLGHDDATERDVVRTELARIVALRLERLVSA